MNDKIQHIIQEIRTKKEVLATRLHQQSNRVVSLEQEVEQLKRVLNEKELQNNQLAEMQQQAVNDNGQLQQVVTELKSELETLKNQKVEPTQVATSNHVQIDELVREIEYCIGQLKK